MCSTLSMTVPRTPQPQQTGASHCNKVCRRHPQHTQGLSKQAGITRAGCAQSVLPPEGILPGVCSCFSCLRQGTSASLQTLPPHSTTQQYAQVAQPTVPVLRTGRQQPDGGCSRCTVVLGTLAVGLVCHTDTQPSHACPALPTGANARHTHSHIHDEHTLSRGPCAAKFAGGQLAALPLTALKASSCGGSADMLHVEPRSTYSSLKDAPNSPHNPAKDSRANMHM